MEQFGDKIDREGIFLSRLNVDRFWHVALDRRFLSKRSANESNIRQDSGN
jgi:hypothetical protein